jgi:hypothetical protein
MNLLKIEDMRERKLQNQKQNWTMKYTKDKGSRLD